MLFSLIILKKKRNKQIFPEQPFDVIIFKKGVKPAPNKTNEKI
jgi:hypothetical protein